MLAIVAPHVEQQELQPDALPELVGRLVAERAAALEHQRLHASGVDTALRELPPAPRRHERPATTMPPTRPYSALPNITTTAVWRAALCRQGFRRRSRPTPAPKPRRSPSVPGLPRLASGTATRPPSSPKPPT
ncbi:MAG: hypothetical protein R3C69_16000 [Geminicoccaceae bacterium]